MGSQLNLPRETITEKITKESNEQRRLGLSREGSAEGTEQFKVRRICDTGKVEGFKQRSMWPVFLCLVFYLCIISRCLLSLTVTCDQTGNAFVNRSRQRIVHHFS